MKRKILAGVLALTFSIHTHGQSINKLQETGQQSLKTEAKETLVFQESYKAISTVMLLNVGLQEAGFLKGMQQVDPSEIPEIYDFEWKYTFILKTKEGEKRMNFLFKKDAPYFGLQISEDRKRYLVVDPERNINVFFTNLRDVKNISAVRILDAEPVVTKKGKNHGTFSFNKVGDKRIAGYESEGFQAENEDFVYTFYIAKETGTGIHDFHRYSEKLIPRNFDSNWLEKGMLMLMIAEGKKSVRDNITFTCIEIEKYSLQLRKNDNSSLAKN